mgnify:CR=1 FL=1
MAFHIHLLGCYLRCRMRIADISARQICFYLDFVVNTVLQLSFLQLSELPALFYEQVENAFEQDLQSEEELLTDTETEPEIVSEKEVPVSYTEIIEKVANWIKTDGYVQQGLTIKELSEILHTNRTYLSAYIKTTYKMTFREWITGLRLEYAKNILKEHPEINIQKLAESSGFLSRSNFIKSFTEKEGCTPGKWKKANLE